MKNVLLRSSLLSVVILAVPIALAVITKKYYLLAGLGVMFITSFVCSILGNSTKRNEENKKKNDLAIQLIDGFGNFAYLASVLVGVVLLFVK